MLTLLADITFTEVMLTAMVVGMLDQTARRFLPDHIAGPGGWLLDTTVEDEARS